MRRTDKDLLEQAQKLHLEAQELLIKDGLLATIQQFGPAVISGSFALNLMVRREIDVNVRLSDDLDIKSFFAIGVAITQQLQVLKASYSNHFIRHFPGFDHGLFWGIQLKHNSREWKLDLWGYGPNHFDEHGVQFEQLRDNLKSLECVTILRIKDTLYDGKHYRYGVSGNDIYTAVITANVRTVEQFCNWWKRKTVQ